MKHVSQRALLAGAIETKGEEDDPVAIITKSLEDLTKTVDDRLKAVETKSVDLKPLTDRLDKIEAKANRPAGGGEDKTKEPAVERKAFTGYQRSGRESLSPDETKALRVGDDTAGGYLAPAEFVAEIVKGVVEFSPIRMLARVGSTGSGSVILPKRTGTPTASWVGETETRPGTESAYGQAEIPVHELACYVDVSNKLLEDAAVNIEAEVASDLAEQFGKREAVAFVSGDGNKKPVGILADSAVAYTATGNASTLGSAPADLLIGFLYQLPATYRARGSWLMNGSTLAAIRKLKDSVTGAYIWQPSLAVGAPETLLGRPVYEAVDMPDVGSAAEPIAFGDFDAAYRIYDRVAISILRDPYSQATAGLTRFHARRRVGAAVVLAEAIRKIRCATS